MKKILMCIIGNVILSFGLYHVHSFSGVTEGGILGAMLLIQHWLHISPAISGVILDAVCYLIGWKYLGKSFIGYSIVSVISFSISYAIFEQYPPMWPVLAEKPLLAAIIGAMFVGVGVGLSVRSGGAPGGDDALAMVISKVLHCDIRWPYLVTDFIVLALSLTYLSYYRIAVSFVSVLLSGQIIGLVQKARWDSK